MIASLFIATSPDASETISHWLYTNAPAAWISAFIAICSLLLVLRSRKKPRKIIVRETRKGSLVHVWPRIRDKIVINFNGKEIRDLAQLDFELLNTGSEVISRPRISLSLDQDSCVLDAALTPDRDTTLVFEHNTVTFSLPYINPYKDHGQPINLTVLVDGPTQNLQIVGGGEGWSVQHFALPDRKQIFKQLRIAGWGVTPLWIGVIAYLIWGDRLFGLKIPATEFSWRAFWFTLPATVTYVATGLWLYRLIRRLRRVIL